MLRLNTSIAPKAPAAQSPLGVLGGDTAGFPNGRRPGDDVVDIALRAVEGILLSSNPAAFPAVTDGAFVSATVGYTPEGDLTGDPAFRLFRDTFPYSADSAFWVACSGSLGQVSGSTSVPSRPGPFGPGSAGPASRARDAQ